MDEQTFLTKVKGFTPVIDILAQEVGTMTALVYGIVWRYCQMEDKVCRASRETIGKHANISAKTVQRHLYELVKKGYLIDTTPNIRHKSHVYKDAGKVIIEGLIEAKLAGGTQSPTSTEGETESPAGLDRESHQGRTESPIKRDSYDTSQDRKKEPPSFDDLQEAQSNELPPATDGHQLAVDLANGSKTIEPAQEIAKHLFWGFERGPADLPPGKEWKKWHEGGKRLLRRLPKELTTHEIIGRVDIWFADADSKDAFWHDNPLHDTALDIIARFVKNGGTKPNGKNRDTLSDQQRRALA